MKKALTGGVLFLLACGALILGTLVLEQVGTARENRAQVTIRELEARAAEAEAAQAEAEALPRAIREEYLGQAEVALVEGQVAQGQAMAQALILMATEDTRARDEWRTFVQMAAIVGVAVIALFGTVFYGRPIADRLGTSSKQEQAE